MKFLTNIYDPKAEDAKLYFCHAFNESHNEAWNNFLDWLENKIIGEPKATAKNTVEQLKAMRMVGVYTL